MGRRLLVALGVLVFVAGTSGVVGRELLGRSRAPAAQPCNGHVELCGRRYDQVSFVATHNAMSAADQPGWFFPEQPDGLVAQLDAGARVLLLDAWYGRATTRPGLVVNAGAPEVPGADPGLTGALDVTPVGPVGTYLCHVHCSLGSLPMLDALAEVRAWLAGHPREVVTLLIENHVSADDTADLLSRAGLARFAHTQTTGRPWPTLGELIGSGQRLQVFLENLPGADAAGADPAHPFLLSAFAWIQDTSFANPTPEALSCVRARGADSNGLFLLMNYLNGRTTRVADAERVNAFDVLLPYARRCQQERGRLPNFVAVDFYDKGDVFAVVDRLNGVG